MGYKTRQERKKESRAFGKWVMIIFVPILLLCAGYFGAGFAETDTEYQYSIKTQQVFDNDRINESVALQDLSEDEQQLLYDAFKKTDHFFGSEEITVTRTERLETFDGWRVVEYNGVYMLVAIDGPEERQYFTSVWSYVAMVVMLLSTAISLVGLKEYIFPSAY